MNTVGIDFGTTKTLAAYLDQNTGHAELIHLGRSGPELPTTIHVDRERQMLFGDDADDQLAIDPAGYLRRVKQGLGTDRKFLLNGHEFQPVDLAAKYLEHVRQRVENEHFHGKIGRAVITAPAKFGPAARADLESAAKQAGFDRIELLDEPIAAGIAFLKEKAGSGMGNQILVFDWGGGTLDIALVERDGDQWRLDHDHLEGDLNLGGEDIDEALMDAVNGQLESTGAEPITPAHTGDYPHLFRRVVETKKLLSKKESHRFSHHSERCQINFSCTREDFEGLIDDLVRQAMACLARWRERAGVRGQGIQNVLLIGGTSQIPVVAKRLSHLGLHPIPWTRGLHAVGMGAALQASGSTNGSKALAQDRSLLDARLSRPSPATATLSSDRWLKKSVEPPASKTPRISASKSAPFENHLGMRFVPVPIIGGPTDGKTVLFSIWQTRVQDYAAYAAANPGVDMNWKNVEFEGYKQEKNHPVVCVLWEDSTAFCKWLTGKERSEGLIGPQDAYRLPTDHEWSCAVGIGSREKASDLPSDKHNKIPGYPWGNAWPPPKGAGNLCGEEVLKEVGWFFRALNLLSAIKGYRDPYVFTAPVGSFTPSAEGLYDLSGNVSEWCEDWYDSRKASRVLRGGCWYYGGEADLRSSSRSYYAPAYRRFDVGFRCLLGLGGVG